MSTSLSAFESNVFRLADKVHYHLQKERAFTDKSNLSSIIYTAKLLKCNVDSPSFMGVSFFPCDGIPVSRNDIV